MCLNNKTPLIFCLLLICSFAGYVYAQPSPSPNPTTSPTNQEQVNPEVIALRAQLEVMREYDQRLLGTVYWSLGGMGGVLLLVVGLGWYTNFRLYKRDVEDLKRDILIAVKSEMTSAARDAVNTALRDFRKMQYQLLELEVQKYENAGYARSTLSTYVQMIELGKSYASQATIPDVLDRMLRFLKGKEVSLDAHTTSEIVKTLETLPKEYAVEVEAIMQQLHSIRAKPVEK